MISITRFLFSLYSHAALSALLLLLSGCDGGASGNDASTATPPPPTTVSFAPSSSLAARCAAPRTGGNPFNNNQPFPDTLGTLANEKDWVRSWIDETYLWYKEVPNASALAYATPVDYFNVLKTPALTASGNPKDRFHFTYDTKVWQELSRTGVEAGYGVEWALISRSPPRKLVVAYTDPGTPAAAANLLRGAEVVSIDGVDFVNGADVATLNAGAFPSDAGKQTTFVVRDAGALANRTVTMTSIAVTKMPVQNVHTIDTPTGRVGYILFNDHIATAEKQLVSAISQLGNAGISDLVLDMRYNGGGYLDIAAELGYMIAGPERTNGRTFERLAFNDKNPFNFSAADTITPFHALTQGFSLPTKQALPSLGLSRVFVLTSSGTCSASEAVINGLRGVDVDVKLIGGTTCGKPFGFYAQDNCGTTYFAIQFQGVNAKGFGEYTDGFTPTCSVADDFSKPLGDPAEGRLAAALGLRASGTCPPPASGTGYANLRYSTVGDPELIRSPARENRLIRLNKP